MVVRGRKFGLPIVVCHDYSASRQLQNVHKIDGPVSVLAIFGRLGRSGTEVCVGLGSMTRKKEDVIRQERKGQEGKRANDG